MYFSVIKVCSPIHKDPKTEAELPLCTAAGRNYVERPTATQTVLSSIRRPSDEMGNGFTFRQLEDPVTPKEMGWRGPTSNWRHS